MISELATRMTHKAKRYRARALSRVRRHSARCRRLWLDFTDTGGQIIGTITDAGGQLIGTITDAGGQILCTLGGTLSDTFSETKSMLSDTKSMLSDTFSDTIYETKSMLSDTKGVFSDARDLLLDTGGFIADSNKDLVLGTRDMIVDTLRSIPLERRRTEIVLFNERGQVWGEMEGGAPVGGYAAGAAEDVAGERDGGAGPVGGAPQDGAAGGSGDAAEGAEEPETKTIYVLVTRNRRPSSLLLRLFVGDHYTHSSIALEQDGNFYSFNPRRGFTVERPIRKKRGDTKCRLYHIEAPARAFADVESRINWFLKNPDAFKFNYLGLFFTLMRIPVGVENAYFCSQFISELLTHTGAASLRSTPNRYLPRYFDREADLTKTFTGSVGQLAAIYAENDAEEASDG